MASRGRLAGKTLPIFGESPDSKKTRGLGDDLLPVSVSSVSSFSPTATVVKFEIVDQRGRAFDDLGPCPAATTADSYRSSASTSPLSHSSHQISISKTLSLQPELQSPEMLELVHHYDHNLAATLVWVDSSDNPWRHVILPLAYNEPSLLYAVLAIAAEHLSQRAPNNSLHRVKHQADAARYRDKSLELLARQLEHEMQGQQSRQFQHLARTLAHPDTVSATAPSAKSILATMLMLCQLEMVNSESLIWKIHLQASHTMIQRWLLSPSRIDMTDTDSKFLIKETFTIDVFAATSSFSPEDEGLAYEDADDHTLFSGFMTVIQLITRTERKIAFGLLDMDFPPDLPDIEQRLEDARVSTHQLASNYDRLVPEDVRQDFDRVVDIYHYAGIIYAYQALANPAIAKITIAPHLDTLLYTLHRLPASGLFAQDLAWPLFIASTECRDRIQERAWLQRKMEDSADATGFASCHQAWQFLRKWWAKAEDARLYASWIGFARARAGRGHNFLVF